ncbi:hypothetical protein PC129_g4577 [Phytophthora cactorum]|uniref:Ubiquitin-like protease family profile domain-containing protein n=1 Tax=Phytophthora cactorum TaxID=29920 RepID=A0A8T1IL20_9STRA|nr:hypothetical protein PC111_g17266 [Phytophthora cactorum]KAG3088869.1 hypothetical protein PC122_g8164 [Phytophthora cactorum]KAG3224796.1 hypothetical protein PC129_g4577 [Phytophthora cactorum]
MQAATTSARKEKTKPDELDDDIKGHGIVLDLVASIDPKIWKFSSRFVHASAGFYTNKAKAKAWNDDRKWLEQDWRKVNSDVRPFAGETNTSGISGTALCDRHQVLANEIIAKFSFCRLRTEFLTQSSRGLISFANVVGGLCRGWLNDSPIDLCLGSMIESHEKCIGLSALAGAVGWPTAPDAPLGEYEYIITPVNMKANHWGIIIVRIYYKGA